MLKYRIGRCLYFMVVPLSCLMLIFPTLLFSWFLDVCCLSTATTAGLWFWGCWSGSTSLWSVIHSITHHYFSGVFFFLIKEFIVFLLYFLLFPIVFGRPTSNLISYIKTFFFPLQVVAAVQRCIHYGESCERLSDQPTNLQSAEQQQQNSGE